jgi:hypothetical protein
VPTEFESNNHSYPPRQPDFGPEPLSSDQEDDALWDMLSAYVDGEATPEEAAHVEAMLRTDPAYARQREFLQMTAESARSYVEIEPPESLRAAIFAATTHRPTLARRLAAGWSDLRRALAPGALRYGLPAGALAAAAVLVVAFWPHHSAVSIVKPLPTETLAQNQPASPPPHISSHRNGQHGVKRKETPTQLVYNKSEPTVKETWAQKHRGEEHPRLMTADARSIEQPSKVSPANLVKPPKIKYIFPHPGIHHPKPDAADDMEAVAYRSKPGMDEINQRLAWAKDSNASQDPALTDNTNTPSVASADAEKNGGTATAPQNSPTSKAPPASHYAGLTPGRMGHLLREQLPPDPHLILTNADLKRQREAATLGYGRDALQSIQRGQATVALLSSKF